jgi:hypothetical protein
MLHDYAKAVGRPNQPELSYLMLIGEAGRLKDIVEAASAAFHVVLKMRSVGSGPSLLRYLDNQVPYLSKRGRLRANDHATLAGIRSRFAPTIKPEDF